MGNSRDGSTLACVGLNFCFDSGAKVPLHAETAVPENVHFVGVQGNSLTGFDFDVWVVWAPSGEVELLAKPWNVRFWGVSGGFLTWRFRPSSCFDC
mmetsp:Transcript_6389/g.9303  ORF Transcript_6389/g.9303 Transcript_6389/m.9303 type:complete len:96 (-) Transcript_6389:324-611(-)